MNNKIVAAAAFAIGAAVGSVFSWKLADKKYNELVQEEIDSVKKVFRKILEEERSKIAEKDLEEKIDNDPTIPWVSTTDEEMIETTCIVDRFDVLEKKIEDLKTPSEDGITIEYGPEINEGREIQEKPYPIDPKELGELPDYAVVPLTFYADKILADEQNSVMEDVDRMVGEDFIDYIGVDEPNAAFIRNDMVKCDYEITCSDLTYVESLPGGREN